MIISWFSAGVSSAVATKLAIQKYGDVKIIYIHIDDQHEDTMRFVNDCEKWFGQEIEVLQSDLLNVENACRKAGFVKSPYGAKCTTHLKRRVRAVWEMDKNIEFTYVWGFDMTEKDRVDRLVANVTEHKNEFPLLDNNIDKQSAHGILEKAGIKRPHMYDLGYPNNNCIGCLKGGMGYWRKIKKDFREVFDNRCKMERDIGGRVFNEFFLDELPDDRGNDLKVIVPDCGLFCDAVQ